MRMDVIRQAKRQSLGVFVRHYRAHGPFLRRECAPAVLCIERVAVCVVEVGRLALFEVEGLGCGSATDDPAERVVLARGKPELR